MNQGVVKWRVLAVDDDPEKLNELERILGGDIQGNQFVLTKVISFDEGIKLIDENRFDFVFLDVHEAAGDPAPSQEVQAEDQRGEDVLRHLQSERFLPVIFYTGYPEKVRHLESLVVRVVDKGATVEEIRSEVLNILKTKLPQLTRYLEEQSRSYIWGSLEELSKQHSQKIDFPDISLLLARRLAGSLSQSVIKELLGMDMEKINPLEMYQYPPLAGSCSPADIYKRKSDDSLWMVFTPACDFEQNKAENVLLARVVPLKEHLFYQEWIQKARIFDATEAGDRSKGDAEHAMKKAKGEVKSLVSGKRGERYKFLPGTFFLPDCIVDFQDLLNFPRANDGEYEILCSLDNPYREELLHLFSKYYGRIGTPDYDSDPVWKRIEGDFLSR